MKDGEKVQFEGVRIRALNHLTRLLPITKIIRNSMKMQTMPWQSSMVG